MNLSDILDKQVIKIPLKGEDKSQIIEEMVDVLAIAGRAENRDQVLKAVLDRERVMSTGMGDGIAIPHAKTDGVKDLVAAFGITQKDVDFQSIDNKPVRIVFLLVGPVDQTGPHLKALSRISRLMHRKEFRDRLALARSAEEVLKEIADEERKYFAL